MMQSPQNLKTKRQLRAKTGVSSEVGDYTVTESAGRMNLQAAADDQPAQAEKM